jgi:hypothetical protein
VSGTEYEDCWLLSFAIGLLFLLWLLPFLCFFLLFFLFFLIASRIVLVVSFSSVATSAVPVSWELDPVTWYTRENNSDRQFNVHYYHNDDLSIAVENSTNCKVEGWDVFWF